MGVLAGGGGVAKVGGWVEEKGKGRRRRGEGQVFYVIVKRPNRAIQQPLFTKDKHTRHSYSSKQK